MIIVVLTLCILLVAAVGSSAWLYTALFSQSASKFFARVLSKTPGSNKILDAIIKTFKIPEDTIVLSKPDYVTYDQIFTLPSGVSQSKSESAVVKFTAKVAFKDDISDTATPKEKPANWVESIRNTTINPVKTKSGFLKCINSGKTGQRALLKSQAILGANVGTELGSHIYINIYATFGTMDTSEVTDASVISNTSTEPVFLGSVSNIPDPSLSSETKTFISNASNPSSDFTETNTVLIKQPRVFLDALENYLKGI